MKRSCNGKKVEQAFSLFRYSLIAAVLSVALLAGCKPPMPPVPPAPVCPPPVAASVLIAQNNANAAKVPSLRANADVEVRFRYKGEQHTQRLPDGLLLLQKNPNDPNAVPSFLLRAVLYSEAYFGAGVNSPQGEFYYWLDPPRGGKLARWGNLADLSRTDMETLPVDPVDMISLLGVTAWPTEGGSRRVFSLPKQEPCVYDMIFVTCTGNGPLQPRRQIWIDRLSNPAHPSRMWIFDEQGNPQVDATLKEYKRIDVPDLPPAQRPMMPTDIVLRYPSQHEIDYLHLRLSGLTVSTSSSPVRPQMFDRRLVIPKSIEDQRPLEKLSQTATPQKQPMTKQPPPSGDSTP